MLQPRKVDLAAATGTSLSIRFNASRSPRSLDADGNSVPDECEGKAAFRRGDANDDGKVDITDGVYVLNFLFTGGEEPSCHEAANANDDPALDLTDAIHVLRFLFLSGPPPLEPGQESCGPDPPGSQSAGGCGEYGGC